MEIVNDLLYVVEVALPYLWKIALVLAVWHTLVRGSP